MLKNTVILILVLCGSLCAQQTNEERLHQDALNRLRDARAQKEAAQNARERAGISIDFSDPEKSGVVLSLHYQASEQDKEILHGPVKTWRWRIDQPDGKTVPLEGQTIHYTTIGPGTYILHLMIADESMRYQQSFTHHFKVNPVVEWDK